MRAKTGTLGTVSTVVGYLGRPEGTLLVALMYNGPRPWAARQAQWRLFRELGANGVVIPADSIPGSPGASWGRADCGTRLVRRQPHQSRHNRQSLIFRPFPAQKVTWASCGPSGSEGLLIAGSTVSAAPITGAGTGGIGSVKMAGRDESAFTSTERTIPNS